MKGNGVAAKLLFLISVYEFLLLFKYYLFNYYMLQQRIVFTLWFKPSCKKAPPIELLSDKLSHLNTSQFYEACQVPSSSKPLWLLALSGILLPVRGITVLCNFRKNGLMPVISCLTSLTFLVIISCYIYPILSKKANRSL